MEESQELEKLPRVVTSVLKVVLSFSLIALALVLIIALAKITYSLAIMAVSYTHLIALLGSRCVSHNKALESSVYLRHRLADTLVVSLKTGLRQPKHNECFLVVNVDSLRQKGHSSM